MLTPKARACSAQHAKDRVQLIGCYRLGATGASPASASVTTLDKRTQKSKPRTPKETNPSPQPEVNPQNSNTQLPARNSLPATSPATLLLTRTTPRSRRRSTTAATTPTTPTSTCTPATTMTHPIANLVQRLLFLLLDDPLTIRALRFDITKQPILLLSQLRKTILKLRKLVRTNLPTQLELLGDQIAMMPT